MADPHVHIRDDLVDAHRRAWDHIARPGSWWTGAQRLELARTVVLAISDDDPLPPWVAVSSSDRLPADRLAPDAAHDAAYRIARHAGTFVDGVYRGFADELGELQYVEVCAIVSTVAALAHFSRNVGMAMPPLPEPIDGDPTGDRPDELAETTMNWVPVAAPADQSSAVRQAFSAVPREHENTWRLNDAQYIPGDQMMQPNWVRRPGGLTRPQIELIAAKVAQLRECFY